METGFDGAKEHVTDDRVQEMILLAERLRDSQFGELDDSAILAIAEATSASPEYVRLAVSLTKQKERRSLTGKVKDAFNALEPDVRRHVVTGVCAANLGVISTAEMATGDNYGLLGVLKLIVLGLGLWSVAISRDKRTAAVSGAILGALWFVSFSLFASVFRLPTSVESMHILPYTLAGAVGGLVVRSLVDKFRGKLGLVDPAKERQELLRQLVTLQDKLRTGEQSISFLSLDIVGSTKIKAAADPLSVEFTFTEYHHFVDRIVKQHDGKVHSTAGDGITCAFEHPQQAYMAARHIQSGLVELNAFRNKTGVPLVLRAGVHTGNVVVPPGEDITKVNFAHVIDMSAHIQKVCPPGGIAVSEVSSRLIPGGGATIGQELIESHDIKAFVWKPRAITPDLQLAPPPMPQVE